MSNITELYAYELRREQQVDEIKGLLEIRGYPSQLFNKCEKGWCYLGVYFGKTLADVKRDIIEFW